MTRTAALSNASAVPVTVGVAVATADPPGLAAAVVASASEVTLPPHGSAPLTLTFTPTYATPLSGTVTFSISVRGGESRTLTAAVHVPEAAVTPSERRVDFGPIPVGVAVTRTLLLTNPGPYPAPFFLSLLPSAAAVPTPAAPPPGGGAGGGDSKAAPSDKSAAAAAGAAAAAAAARVRAMAAGLPLSPAAAAAAFNVTVTPPRGRVPPGGRVLVSVTALAQHAGAFAAAVAVDVRGARARVAIPVAAEAHPASVALLGADGAPLRGLVFRDVGVGATAHSAEVVARNTAPVPATLRIDLRALPHLRLCTPDRTPLPPGESGGDSGDGSGGAVFSAEAPPEAEEGSDVEDATPRLSRPAGAARPVGGSEALFSPKVAAKRAGGGGAGGDRNPPALNPLTAAVMGLGRGARTAALGRDDAEPEGSDAEEEEAAGWLYTVRLAARTTASFVVAFSPTKITSTAIPFPVSVAGVAADSPAVAQLRVPISLHAVRPLIHVSSLCVDFGAGVVAGDGAARRAARRSVRVTNLAATPVAFSIAPACEPPPTSPAAAAAAAAKGGDDVEVGDAAGGPPAFSVAPRRGLLAPGASAVVTAQFFPPVLRAYDAAVILTATPPAGTTPAVAVEGVAAAAGRTATIVLRGYGAMPALLFDADEVTLPCVPLGHTAQAAIRISNAGFAAVPLRAVVPAALASVLTVTFPEGPSLAATAGAATTAVIAFSSPKPISVTTALFFAVGPSPGAPAFGVRVRAQADASLLSTAPYLLLRRLPHLGPPGWYPTDPPVFGCATPGGPITLLAGGATPSAAAAAAWQAEDDAASVTTGGGSGGEGAQSPLGMCERLARRALSRRAADKLRAWVNAFVLDVPLVDLSLALSANMLRPARLLVEAACGSSPAHRRPATGGPAGATTREAAAAELEIARDLLASLRAAGALVADVAPEYLVSFETYSRTAAALDAAAAATLRPTLPKPPATPSPGAAVGDVSPRRRMSGASGGGVGQARPSTERGFGARAQTAWGAVVVQSVKLVVASKVSWARLVAAPQSRAVAAFRAKAAAGSEVAAWDARKVPPSLVGSAVYSHAELCLLLWLTIHVQYAFPGHAAITTFDADLRSGAAVAACVALHVPFAVRHLGVLPAADSSPGSAGTRGGRGGVGVVPRPRGTDEMVGNWALVAAALADAAFPLRIAPHEAVAALGARDGVLLAAALFDTLPHYLPRREIALRGPLHAPASAVITAGPVPPSAGGSPVEYSVVVDAGAPGWAASHAAVVADAAAAAKVTVTTIPRFCAPAVATLAFLPSRWGGSLRPAVFSLATDVDVAASQSASLSLSAGTFELAVGELTVPNAFDGAAFFAISVAVVSQPDGAAAFPPAFWLGADAVGVRRGAAATLAVQFLAFVPGAYSARVTLRDDRLGELLAGVTATAGPPPCSERLVLTTTTGRLVSSSIVIPRRSPLLERAAATAAERARAARRGAALPPGGGLGGPLGGAAREPGGRVVFSVVSSCGGFSFPAEVAVEAGADSCTLPISCLPKAAGKYAATLLLRAAAGDVRRVEVECDATLPPASLTCEFVTPARRALTQNIPVAAPAAASEAGRDTLVLASVAGDGFSGPLDIRVPAGGVAQYPLTFAPAWRPNAGPAAGRLTLRASDGGAVATYTLVGRVEPPLAEGVVDVAGPARGRVVRQITVRNVATPPRDAVYALVTDLPCVDVQATGPVVSLRAGESRAVSLVVRPLRVGVCVGAVAFHQLPPGATAAAAATAPIAAGTPPVPESSALPFLWWAVTVHASAPDPEGVVAVEGVAREESVFSVPLPPVPGATFDVRVVAPPAAPRPPGLLGGSFSGADLNDGPAASAGGAAELAAVGEAAAALSFPPTVTVPGEPGTARGGASLAVRWLPCRAGTARAALCFASPTVGDYVHLLSLSSAPAPAADLGTLQAAVGASRAVTVEVRNPTAAPVSFSATSSAACFVVSPPVVSVAPFSSAAATVTFVPDAVGVEVAAVVSFTHPTAGVYDYRVQGVGTAPLISEVTLSASVGGGGTASVQLRNPFPTVVRFVATTTEAIAASSPVGGGSAAAAAADQQQVAAKCGVFSLAGRRVVDAAPGATVSFNVVFSPYAPCTCTASLTVAAVGSPLTWQYLLRGVGERIVVDPPLRLAGEARQERRVVWALPLPGAGRAAIDPAVFDVTVDTANSGDMARALRSSLAAALVRREDYVAFCEADGVPPSTPTGAVLYVAAVFSPLRAVNATCELVASRASRGGGGSWRWPLWVAATAPAIDDTITVSCAVGASSSVAFALANAVPKAEPYTAFFETETSELLVSPTSGTLPPAGSPGVQIVVTASPRTPMRPPKSVLVVETADMQWRYAIKCVVRAATRRGASPTR